MQVGPMGPGALLGELSIKFPSLYSVLHEMGRAERLHGPLPSDDGRRLAVLGREVGEVFDAEGDVDRARRDGRQPGYIRLEHLYDELSQVASTCVLWMDAIRKEQSANVKP